MTARKKKPEPEVIPAEDLPEEIVEVVEISPFEKEMIIVKQELDKFYDENVQLRKEFYEYTHPKIKPWYTSPGIWAAMALTLLTIYLVYVFYMSEKGYIIRLPDWLNQTIILK